jgi:tetratricopeptide (TPR) repeat protein
MTVTLPQNLSSITWLNRNICRSKLRSYLLQYTKITIGIMLSISCVGAAFGQSMQFNDNTYGQPNNDNAQVNLDEGIKSYNNKDYLRASLLLFDIIKDKETAVNPVDEKAEYFLGKTLYHLNLYQASFEFFVRIVKSGNQHRYFKTTCKWLFYLSRQKISGDDELLKRIASYEPQDCADISDKISFLRGQYHYKLSELDEALRFLSQVSRDDEYFLSATFLRGVTYSRLGQLKDAISTFAEILRYTFDAYNGITSAADVAFRRMRNRNAKPQNQISTARLIDNVAQGDYKRDLKYYSQLAVLNMARLLYEQNKNRKAVRYYDYIPINGFFWLEALFESSWALFRMGKGSHEKALGNLHTLSSPYFRDEYVPEAPILKAVILYSSCEFDKALSAVNEFREVYEQLLLELDGYVKDFSDPKQLYDFLHRIQADPSSSPRVSQILNALFEDSELKRVNAHITEMDRELKVIQVAQSRWASSDLANYVVQTIEFTRDIAFDRAGQMAKARLARVVEELRDLQGKADAIDIEISTSDRTDTELSLSGVEMQRRLQIESKKRTPDSEHIYWPFDGEYWRDELGYYLYSIKSKCGR